MNRLGRALRVGFFPLLIALGVAALAAGYFEWKRFFGDLYLEEMQAIEAAVATGAEVEYRRAGEPRNRVASRSTGWQGQVVDSAWDRERTTVPGNAPFLGRVESIKLREQRYMGLPLPTEDARDGMLRLPGLKSFEGRCDDVDPSGSDSPPSVPRDVEQALGHTLPELPERTLTLRETEAPLPDGDPLDPPAREALAAEIAKRWKQARPLGSYIARAEHRPSDSPRERIVVTEIVDGDRFVSRIDSESLLNDSLRLAIWSRDVSKFGPLLLRDATRAFVFNKENGAWRRSATLDRATGLSVLDAARFAPKLLSLRALPRLSGEGDRFGLRRPLSLDEENLLGENGANVVAIERVDDVRLRLDLAPQEAKAWDGLVGRIEMIVREDLDFAVERFDVRLQPSEEDSQGYRLVISVARRLARAGEAIYAQETLRSDRVYLLKLDPNEPQRGSDNSERTLTAIVTAPEIPSAVFDPLAYDPTAWPEPRELPAIRSYRMLWSLGAGLIAVGAIGPLFLRLGSRRPARVSDEVQESRAAAPARLPRFRFGLAALFAAALAMISAAGAIKQVRDVVTRDVETLRRLEGWAEIERHEARFPWSLFSTPAFPLDAPVKRISISAVMGEDVPAASDEVVKELVANPRLESFQDLSVEPGGSPREYVLADAAAALSRSLPKLPEPIPPLEEALWLYKMPEGEALSEKEQTAFVGRLVNAWQKMSAEFPQDYLLVESHDHYGLPEARATLRSGERYWAMGGKNSVFVSSRDDRYRYRFGAGGENRSLVERTRLGASPLERVESQDIQPMFAGSMQESPFHIDQPGHAAEPPFAFPRYLYDGIENFDVVARAALDPSKILRVSRLDDGRHRIDFDETEVELKGKAFAWGDDVFTLDPWQDGGWTERSTDEVRVSIRVAELALLVREDLDCAVERTYCKAMVYRGSHLDADTEESPSLFKWPTRSLYVTNRFMRTPEGIVVPKSSRIGDDQGGNRTWWDSRFAYDFVPEIDERIFSSPSLSELEPYPVTEERWRITWPFVTGGLSLAMFAGLGGRRIAGAIRRRKASGR